MNKYNNPLALLLALVTIGSIVKTNAQIMKKTDSLKTIHVSDTRKNLKPYIVPCTSMFLSGALDGTIETLSFHYCNGFKSVFPNANDQFWNAAVSWTNKYKNGCPLEGPKFTGSTTYLVSLTDAYHALRTARNYTTTLTVVYYLNSFRHASNKPKLGKIIKDVLLLAAIRNLGFFATYSFLFKGDIHSAPMGMNL
jgi:hypothetical protein